VSEAVAARSALGYLPESAAVYPELRVREYLTFRARLEGVAGGDVKTRVAEALETCLLGEVADRKIDNLSKGFRQRTALAGALVHRPPVLILDEPTIGLDPVQIIKIRETIRALSRDRAVLLSTHILPEVEAVCDRVLIIDKGRIVAEGTPSDLRAKLAGAPVVRVAFKGTVPAAELARVPGVAGVDVEGDPAETRARVTCAQGADPREEIFRMAVEKGWVLRELSRASMSLEDVFVRLTRHDEADAATRVAAEEADAAPAPVRAEEPPQ
jgi:ABC-2 type transport system ATP-binding protein